VLPLFSMLFLIIPAVVVLIAAESAFLGVQRRPGLRERARARARTAWDANRRVCEAIQRIGTSANTR